jgi:HSP20 family protein
MTQDFDSVFSEFQRSFGELLAPFQPRVSPSVSAERPTRSPVVEVLDRGDQYTVTVELPGFSRDMVDVQVNKTGPVLRARKKEQAEDKGRDYFHRERSEIAFEHELSFPDEVDPKKFQETMRHGVLELRVPKKEPKKPAKPVGKN